MRVVVIGGSGHIGGFLVPRLARAGHEVVSISRGQSSTYHDDPAWEGVRQVSLDRAAAEADGTFGSSVAELDADAVVDLICFTTESARALVECLRGRTGHYVYCGSIWRAGPSVRVPITEDDMTPALAEYGIEKRRTADWLAEETASGGLVTTSLHPGHIVGPGWAPIGPLGNTDVRVWATLAAGEPLDVPGIGTEFMAHVHADDVAQAFQLAVENTDAAAGEDFHVTGATASNVRGLAEAAASWFGQTAALRTVSWEEFRAGTTDAFAEHSWEHLVRNHAFSIDKARRLLGYEPAHSPEEALRESVAWLIDHGELEVSRPMVP